MTFHGGMSHHIATKMLAEFTAIRIFTSLIGGPVASPSALCFLVVLVTASFVATTSFLILPALLLVVIIAIAWFCEGCFPDGGKYLLEGLEIFDDIL